MFRESVDVSPEERAMLEGTWPLDLVLDPARAPLVASSTLDFARHVLLESHLDEVVVLRGSQLDLTAERCLPAWFRDGLPQKSVLSFLRHVAAHCPEKAKLKCNVEYVDDGGIQREAKPSDRRSSSSGSRSAATSIEDRIAAAERYAGRPLYCCEMRKRRAEKRPKVSCHHPCALLGANRTKTILHRQIADAFGDLARFALSWDNSDDGLFIGGRGAGKGLHVDQVLWSNVGANLCGYKLLVTWDHGRVSTHLHTTMLDAVFGLEPTFDRIKALRTARTVCFLRPGDVFCLSGGVAHATLSVSRDLNVTAYESFVSLNCDNARHFLRTGKRCPDVRYRLASGTMPRTEVEDFKDNTIDALEAIFEHPRLDDEEDAWWFPLENRDLERDLLLAAARVALFLHDSDEFYAEHLPRRLTAAARHILEPSASARAWFVASPEHRQKHRASSSGTNPQWSSEEEEEDDDQEEGDARPLARPAKKGRLL